MTNRPHDALFRGTFERVEHAVGELQSVLPADVVDFLDWSTLCIEQGSFVSDALEDRYSDLLYSIERRDGSSALLYVLFEHQSTVDARMALRLLGYMVAIWNRWDAEHGSALPLPVIIPVVLHHGEDGWTAATRFEDLFGVDDLTELSVLTDYVPSFRFELDDIGGDDAGALQGRARLTAVARLVLWCLTRGRSAGFVDELRRHAELFRAVVGAPDGVRALNMVMRYIHLVSEADPDIIEAVLADDVGPEAREAFVTSADKLRAEGRAEGRTEGRAEGLGEGRREVLHKLLQLKFGDLPASVLSRLQTASIEELDGWAARILGAETIDDLFD